jgi:hypothetical protein
VKHIKRFLALLLLLTNINLYAQTELKEFEQKKYLTFNSKDHPKNKGLTFEMKYPKSYSTTESKNENIVKGFVHHDYSLIYMIGVVETTPNMTKSEEDSILSRSNLEQSVKIISNNNYSFVGYKNNITVNGHRSAYLEYSANVTTDTKSIIRQYFVLTNGYAVTISFSVPVFPNSTLTATKKKFDNYKAFFTKAANTLKIEK